MKIFYSILVLVSSFQYLFCQVIIDNTHLPRVGDSFYFEVDTSLMAQPALSGGLYDFSKLSNHSESVIDFKVNDNPSLYPSSNLKTTSSGPTAADIYLKKTTNDLAVISFGSGAIPSPIPFDPILNGGLKYLSFPLNQSSNISSSDSFKLTIPASLLSGLGNIDSIIKEFIPPPYNLATITLDSIVASVLITINIKSIGFGKIKTPVDQDLDVLKVERTTKPSVSFNIHLTATLGIKIPLVLPASSFIPDSLMDQLSIIDQLALKEHIYYTPTIRQPIVTAVVDSSGNYISTSYRYKTVSGPKDSSGSGGSGGGSGIAYSDFSKIYFEFFEDQILVHGIQKEQSIEASLYSLDGRSVKKVALSKMNNLIRISNLSNGIIQLRDISKDQIISSYKFMRL